MTKKRYDLKLTVYNTVIADKAFQTEDDIGVFMESFVKDNRRMLSNWEPRDINGAVEIRANYPFTLMITEISSSLKPKALLIIEGSLHRIVGHSYPICIHRAERARFSSFWRMINSSLLNKYTNKYLYV